MDYKGIINQAVGEIFSTMLFLEVAELSSEPIANPDQSMLTGMIGFAGILKGTVNIHLPKAVAIAITNAFLELDLEEVNDEVKDAIGELANMVAGGIKYLLPEQGHDVQLSIPSVISGRGYTCEATGKTERFAVEFETAGGRFITELLVR
ncbi:MAG: chemotaxis protein CheX [Desulfuromonadaceae bacterium]|nr:chemotaxis protein CheX [Desulfuromonadaceae bacterium]